MAMRLRLSSASTVERRARDVSRRRSRSTSRATAEAASSMAVTALWRVSNSLSSMHGILPEPVPLVVAPGRQVIVHGRPDNNPKVRNSSGARSARRQPDSGAEWPAAPQWDHDSSRARWRQSVAQPNTYPPDRDDAPHPTRRRIPELELS